MDTPTPSSGPQPTPAIPVDRKDGPIADQSKDLAALSYVWVLSVFIYATKKDQPFIRFHARQGMTLFVLSVAAWFVPVVGQILELVVLALCVLGFLAASQGQWKELPIIGPLSIGEWSHVKTQAHDYVKAFRRVFNKQSKAASTPPAPAASHDEDHHVSSEHV